MKKIFTIGLFLFTGSQLFSQIATYSINDTIVGIDTRTYDFNNDLVNDFKFEIIDLSPNGLGARVVSQGNSSFMDNSTFGYPDALNNGNNISGPFNTGNGVLGTFNSAGNFNGNGIKYLGININSLTNNYLGWVEVYTSINNDTIIIKSIGYNTVSGDDINAGQSVITDTYQLINNQIKIYPNPTSDHIQLQGVDDFDQVILVNQKGQQENIDLNGNRISLKGLSNGLYSLYIHTQGMSFTKKVNVIH